MRAGLLGQSASLHGSGRYLGSDSSAFSLKHLLDRRTLQSRSRLTNTSALLLILCLVVSVLVNLRHAMASNGDLVSHLNRLTKPLSRQLAPRTEAMLNMNHLVLVPCHAIWKGTAVSEQSEQHWWLSDVQKDGGRTVDAIKAHIKKAITIAKGDAHALLVFSGGETRKETRDTEAESYARLATALEVKETQVTTENYALDSYQNILFGLARYHELTGSWPKKITVVGFQFKQKRFQDLHRRALRWPLSRFEYIGIDPEGDMTQNTQGEETKGYAPFEKDLYGCTGSLLSKRRTRNPGSRFHPYMLSAPMLFELFEFCPSIQGQSGSTVFQGGLPWASQRES